MSMIDFRIIRSDRYCREGRPKCRKKFGRKLVSDDIRRLPMRTYSMWYRDKDHYGSYCKVDYGETIKFLYSRIGKDYNDTYSEIIKRLGKKTAKNYLFRRDLLRTVQKNDVVLSSVFRYRRPSRNHYGFYLDDQGILRYTMYYTINRRPSNRKRSETLENIESYDPIEVCSARPTDKQQSWFRLKEKYYVQTFMDGLIIPEKLPVYAIGLSSMYSNRGTLPGALMMFEPVMISGIGYYHSITNIYRNTTTIIFLVKTKNIEKWRKKKSAK